MADLAITGISVESLNGSSPSAGLAGGTIGLAAPIYFASDQTYKAADADLSEAESKATGLAVAPAVAGQQVVFVGSKAKVKFTFSAGTMTVGQTYIVSDVPGGIKPISDAVSGDWVRYLGYAETTHILVLDIRSGTQIP